MSSTKSSMDALSSASCATCFEVVCTTSRTSSRALPAAATSPRCRSATVRISSPSCAARSAASAISAVALRSSSIPVPMEPSAARCSSAPLEISTIAVDTWLDEAASCSLTAERSPADPAIRSDSPITSPTMCRSRSPMRCIASASRRNSRGISPVVTGRRSPPPNRSAAVTSRPSGPCTDCSVYRDRKNPTSSSDTTRTHSFRSRSIESAARRSAACVALSACRRDRSRTRRVSSAACGRTALTRATASAWRPRSVSACAMAYSVSIVACRWRNRLIASRSSTTRPPSAASRRS